LAPPFLKVAKKIEMLFLSIVHCTFSPVTTAKAINNVLQQFPQHQFPQQFLQPEGYQASILQGVF